MPLGTVAEVRATIISGAELHEKGYQFSYLLRVTEVDGRAIEKPATMEFTVPSFARVKLARDIFELHELKTGKKPGQLDSKQITELEKGYVGTQLRLMVYETGGYSGIPAIFLRV